MQRHEHGEYPSADHGSGPASHYSAWPEARMIVASLGLSCVPSDRAEMNTAIVGRARLYFPYPATVM